MYDDEPEDWPHLTRSQVDMIGWLAVTIGFGAGFLTAFLIWS